MSPHALGAGEDCCEAVQSKNLAAYQEHFGELSAQGIRYRPLAMSCYGRMHPEAASVLESVAVKVARSHGFADYGPILQRLRQTIGVRLQVRLASMVRACLPRLTFDELALFGDVDG